MRSLLPLPLFVLGSVVSAQNCSQYAPVSSSGVCECPPGFGGMDCSLPVCGSNIMAGYGSSRTLTGVDESVKNCACDNGWTGSGCTVCSSSLACGTAYNASGYTPPSSTTNPLAAGQISNQSMVCNTSPRVFTAGQMSCEVINPLLQSLWPLSSKLTISRQIDPSLSPIPDVTAVGKNGTLFAQLWYDDVETFFCKANACNQTLAGTSSGNSSTWTCQDLTCTCRPGTAFCSGSFSIADTINTLGGQLVVDCDATGGKCAFKQTLLNGLFGNNGLSLSSCSFGECLSQSTLDFITGTVALTPPVPNDLSHGVIAGLAVVGGLVVLAVLGLIWGCIARSKARRRPRRADKGRRGVGVEWTSLGYKIKTGTTRKRDIVWGAANAKAQKNKEREAEAGAGDLDGKAKDRKGWKMILDGAEGRVEPGKLVAILGPSGAGKSTLIDLLACRRKSGKTTGKVSFFSTSDDQKEYGKASLRPRVGYVDQSDVHSPTSTIREALLFAARLRIPDNVPDEEKRARVEEVLAQLGLTDVADQRIGDGDRRGVSGGEMRRVSIGLELLARPDVLLLDEPTSGLDSVSAAKVVAVLADLAHDRVHPTTVIASIHQPSSKLYLSFDSIILLSLGRQLYQGPGGQEPVNYFVGRGAPHLPLGFNCSDYLIELASDSTLLPPTAPSSAGPPPSAFTRRPFIHRRTDSNIEKGSFNSTNVPESHALQTLHHHPGRARNGSSSSSSSSPHEGSFRNEGNGSIARSSSQTNMVSSNFKPTTKPPAAFLTQLSALCGREWRALRRDWSLAFAHLFVAVVAGVFAGGIYYQVDLTISGFQNRIGSLFFLGSLIAFSSLSALYNLITVRSLFLRERSASYYSPSAWLLSRCLFDVIPLRLIPTIILSTITYWMVGLQPHAANFFKYLLILVLYSLGLTLFNFFLAVVIPRPGVAVLFSSICNLYLLVYAGFFINLGKIPPVLRWLQYFDPLKYCLESLAVNEVSAGLQIVDTLSGIPVNVNATLIMNLLFGFGNNYYRDVIVLFAFLGGYLILTVFAVIFLLRERR